MPGSEPVANEWWDCRVFDAHRVLWYVCVYVFPRSRETSLSSPNFLGKSGVCGVVEFERHESCVTKWYVLNRFSSLFLIQIAITNPYTKRKRAKQRSFTKAKKLYWLSKILNSRLHSIIRFKPAALKKISKQSPQIGFVSPTLGGTHLTQPGVFWSRITLLTPPRIIIN